MIENVSTQLTVFHCLCPLPASRKGLRLPLRSALFGEGGRDWRPCGRNHSITEILFNSPSQQTVDWELLTGTLNLNSIKTKLAKTNLRLLKYMAAMRHGLSWKEKIFPFEFEITYQNWEFKLAEMVTVWPYIKAAKTNLIHQNTWPPRCVAGFHYMYQHYVPIFLNISSSETNSQNWNNLALSSH